MNKDRLLREELLTRDKVEMLEGIALSQVVGPRVLLAISIQPSFVLRERIAAGKEPRPDYLFLQQAHPW